MSDIASYDFIESVYDWDIEKIKKIIAEVQKGKIELCDLDLESIMKGLYKHFSVCDQINDFVADYWQVLPDIAYEILELLRPYYGISDCKGIAHKHFLYEPIMHGDLRMLEYLYKIHPQEFQCPEMNKLLYLGIADFCYMHLPSWEGLAEYKSTPNEVSNEAFGLDSNGLADGEFVLDVHFKDEDALVLDLHSPDFLKQLYSQAERCNVPVPAHLDFLMKLNDSIRPSIKDLTLSVDVPQLKLEVIPATDYDPESGRIWRIKDSRISHKYQDSECLVKSCISSGEYWTLTCECGFPACANVDEPVVTMRFEDTARWRIAASDDEENPEVYYLAVPVKKYLQNMDDLLSLIEKNIACDDKTCEDDYTWLPSEYECFDSTCDGLAKVRKIRALIRKSF